MHTCQTIFAHNLVEQLPVPPDHWSPGGDRCARAEQLCTLHRCYDYAICCTCVLRYVEGRRGNSSNINVCGRAACMHLSLCNTQKFSQPPLLCQVLPTECTWKRTLCPFPDGHRWEDSADLVRPAHVQSSSTAASRLQNKALISQLRNCTARDCPGLARCPFSASCSHVS